MATIQSPIGAAILALISKIHLDSLKENLSLVLMPVCFCLIRVYFKQEQVDVSEPCSTNSASVNSAILVSRQRVRVC